MLLIILSYLGFVLFAFFVFRIIVRRDYLKRKKLTFFSVLLEFIVFAGHANLSYLYLDVSWPNFPTLEPRPLLNAIGAILIVIGLLGVLAGMFRLGFGATLGQGKGSVFMKGLYRWSRNPQLVAYGLVLLGWLVLFPDWVGILWFLSYLPAAHFMAVTEEEYLAREHGKEFIDYCQEVPRYLPFKKK